MKHVIHRTIGVLGEGVRGALAFVWLVLILAAFAFAVYAGFLSEDLAPAWKIGGGVWLAVIILAPRWLDKEKGRQS